MVADRRRDDRAHARRAAAARSRSASCSACCSSPPAPGGCGWSAGEARAPDAAAALETPRRSSAGSARRRCSGSSRASSRRRSTSRSALVAERALGLTWLVFLAGGAASSRCVVLSYVEGASLHQERGGATVIARYALQRAVELHRRLGDPARLPDPDRAHARSRPRTTLAVVLGAARRRASPEFLLGAAVDRRTSRWLNVRGAGSRRYERAALLVLADLVAAAADRRRSGWRCCSSPTC